MKLHPFINYGMAVVMVNKNYDDAVNISKADLAEEVEICLNHFRVKPNVEIIDQTSVEFEYTNDEKGNPAQGVYLSSSVLTTDKGAGQVYAALNKLKEDLDKNKSSNVDITRAITPVSGEFASFGKVIGRGKPKTSIEIASFCAITTSTNKKPCLAFKTVKKEKVEIENIAIIPDFEKLEETIDFINLFERLRESSTKKLLVGNVDAKTKKPSRPRIFDGNFPNAPKSSVMGAVALLGAIGVWAKEASHIQWANKVLDSLKERPIYLIGTKTFESFSYNNIIIELAKENKLSSIVDSLNYVLLYNQEYRNAGNRLEYQKFDLFASRFLQFFSRPTFRDFLSFRAEYPIQFIILLTSYFIKMEKLSEAVVHSARDFGKWLNRAAYKAADEAIAKDAQDRKNSVRKEKAKALTELESSIFAARSGGALICQAITRATRLHNSEAPPEVELFMVQVATGEISLESAKNLLIAFSRLRSKYESVTNNSTGTTDEDSEQDESD